MTTDSGNAPAWLFAFVDLAFLLLIAMTQLGGDPNAITVGEIAIPRVPEETAEPMSSGANQRWQLRVHPLDPDFPAPFELVAPGGVGVRMDQFALRARLEGLPLSSLTKPVLAPHADSRSQDMLTAVAALEQRWPSRRRAAIRPLLPQ